MNKNGFLEKKILKKKEIFYIKRNTFDNIKNMEKFRYIPAVEIKRKGNVVVVSLPKYFYIGNIAEIESAWEKILGNEVSVIGFDCDKLEFIDSSAIGTLVKFFNSSVKNNIGMYVYGLRAELQKVFDTTKINRVMSVISKEEFNEKFLS